MKVSYDDLSDVAYIQLSSKTPDGAVEMAEGVSVHTTADNELVGIEIIGASSRFPIKNLFSFQLAPVHKPVRRMQPKAAVNG